MFEWLFTKKLEKLKYYPEEEFIDEIEKSLWEIKEQYDLETEEVLKTVDSKRKNLSYMQRATKNNS
tara:strand:+ start:144 stop:341 length:198 start_codon:yes stop_codon:yes gene_type:complete